MKTLRTLQKSEKHYENTGYIMKICWILRHYDTERSSQEYHEIPEASKETSEVRKKHEECLLWSFIVYHCNPLYIETFSQYSRITASGKSKLYLCLTN
jgi:hypothetical protein